MNGKTLAELRTEVELGIAVYPSTGECSISRPPDTPYRKSEITVWYPLACTEVSYPSFDALLCAIPDAYQPIWTTTKPLALIQIEQQMRGASKTPATLYLAVFGISKETATLEPEKVQQLLMFVYDHAPYHTMQPIEDIEDQEYLTFLLVGVEGESQRDSFTSEFHRVFPDKQGLLKWKEIKRQPDYPSDSSEKR